MLNEMNASNVWPMDGTTVVRDWFSYSMLKRALDTFVSALVLIATLPLWVVIAIAIKLESRGPVFFCQERVGLNGRHFCCLKFRTMQVDAETRLEEMRRRGEGEGMVFKTRHAPRVTRVGNVLRHTSLDELPQLLNVFKGEMTLVGPRPLIPSQIERFAPADLVRLRVKPGLTCLWVVRGRSDGTFETWMAADREYVSRRSTLLDLVIIFQTIFIVATGRGAY